MKTENLFILLLLIASSLQAQIAVKNLPDGWSQEVLYQSEFLSPHLLCTHENGELLVYDAALNRIIRMDSEGKFHTFLQLTDLHISCMDYQPIAQRLIFLAGNDLYYYENGNIEFQKVLQQGGDISTIDIDPDNDHIYTAGWMDQNPICHYDEAGNYLETLVTNARGCTQIALDHVNEKLYYAETFPGNLQEYDKQNGTITTLLTGLGIPDTDEGIAVALDGDQNLYFFTPVVATSEYSGLNLFMDGTANRIMEARSARGIMVYLPNENAFVNTSSAGGNLVKYNLDELTSEQLFNSVNTHIICEKPDGEVVYGLDSKMYKLSNGIITSFGSVFENGLADITVDLAGNLYASLFEPHKIVKLNADGSFNVIHEPFTEGFMGFIYYDEKNDRLIVFMEKEEGFEIWKMGKTGDNPPQRIYQDNAIGSHHGTVDPQGNIYFYDYEENAIYRVNDDSYTRDLLFKDVTESRVVGDPIILYSAVADGILVAQNDNLAMFPIDGSSRYIFAENAVGIDNVGLYEGPTGNIICTHTGQIFKIFKSGSFVEDKLSDKFKHAYVYPNPVSSELIVDLQKIGNQKAMLKIYNHMGQITLSKSLGILNEQSSYCINVENFTSGTYILELCTDQSTYCCRFLKY